MRNQDVGHDESRLPQWAQRRLWALRQRLHEAEHALGTTTLDTSGWAVVIRGSHGQTLHQFSTDKLGVYLQGPDGQCLHVLSRPEGLDLTSVGAGCLVVRPRAANRVIIDDRA